MHFNTLIKNAFDSKGILASAKNGIWPQNYKAEDFAVVPALAAPRPRL
jgi:hypothetical protein